MYDDDDDMMLMMTIMMATTTTTTMMMMLMMMTQVQGVIYVHVPVRMMLVRTRGAGLVAYGAVAPTAQMLELLGEVVRSSCRRVARRAPSRPRSSARSSNSGRRRSTPVSSRVVARRAVVRCRGRR